MDLEKIESKKASLKRDQHLKQGDKMPLVLIDTNGKKEGPLILPQKSVYLLKFERL